MVAVLLLAAPLAQAQEEDAGAPPAVPHAVEPLRPAEVGRRIEETFRDIQDVSPRLRRQPTFLEVQRQLPAFTETVTRLRNDPALERLDRLHPASLHDLEQEWTRVHARQSAWQAALETRSTTLAEEREHILRARRLWRVTLDVERAHPLPESQVERVNSLLARIRRVKRRIDRRLDEVLGLQGELSDQGLRIAATVARIRSAQRNARQRRSERDHHPIWEGWGRREELPEAASIGEVVGQHRSSFAAFVRTERSTLLSHSVVLALLIGLFLWMRLRTRNSDLEKIRAPSASRALRARPFASALVIGFVVAPIAYPYVPAVAVAASLVFMVPAIVRLLPHLLPAARPPVLGLLVLAAFAVPINLGFVPESIQRVVVLIVQVLAIAGAGWLGWVRWAPEIAAADPTRRTLYRLIQISIFPLGAALYYNFTGYTERAELWTAGILVAVEQAIGLFFAAALLTAAIHEGLRRPLAAKLSYTVRKRRRRTASTISRVVRVGAILAFFFLTLSNFDVLDPTLEALRLAFRRTFTFGEIELSLGDLAAFLAMIAGTFVTMRLVHALLELELLPRLSLDQGISSAISLSVSYVLVAVGIVLAFGSAGVGPERLALLGGALGVGIGFGLQNVVSNFVSGLILVAERPIKVGDVIQIGELVGTVRRIGIRSSTVQSLDGAEVIVPNADLIAGHLVNWTHTDARRRLKLVVGTGYQHAPADVIPVLMEVVRSQPGVLGDPPPDVLCVGFGDSSIDYAIFGWTGGYLDAIRIKSQLALRVYAALSREGIQIPFPQQDIHIVSVSEEAAKRLGDEEDRDGTAPPDEAQ